MSVLETASPRKTESVAFGGLERKLSAPWLHMRTNLLVAMWPAMRGSAAGLDHML